MVKIKCARWTSVDAWRHLKCLMKIERWTLHDDQTSRDDAASSGHSILNRIDVI